MIGRRLRAASAVISKRLPLSLWPGKKGPGDKREKPRDRLEEALRARVGRPLPRASEIKARIVFDTGRGPGAVWTIHFRAGNVSLSRGRASRATSTLFADRETTIELLEGKIAGVEAFLGGRLFVRGNLALLLELDDLLLHPLENDPRAPRCRRVMAGGVASFYLEAGTRGAPPVILLHGLGATSTSFLPTLWDLAQDHHVFAVDLPGFGESGKPIRPLHAAYFARWVVSFLDAVGLERAHLVGNSMGGRVALDVAMRTPERVSRVALLAPSLAWRKYRFASGIVRFLRPELGALPLPMLHLLVMQVLRSLFANPDRVPALAMAGAADEFVRIYATRRGRIAFFNAAREIYLENPHGTRGFWNRLRTLTPPALFVFGAKDILVPRTFLRHVREALPHARCVLLADCGHVPQFELPERTNALLRELFAEPPHVTPHRH